MRNSIILPNNLEFLFIHEAEKSGLIKPIYNFADELYDEYDLLDAEAKFNRFLDRKTNDKQRLFRILLLFDDIILSNVTQNYDYDRLIKTGMFSLFYLEDEVYSDPIHQDAHIEYATYLKPAIVPVFEKNIKSYFKYGQAVDSFENFVSDLYDQILLNKRLPKKHHSFVEQNKIIFDVLNSDQVNKLHMLFGDVPDSITSKRFFTDISALLCVLYESLCWQLEISSNKDAAIIDCDFNLANIGCEEFTKDVTTGMQAYSILRVECGKIIGALPHLNSIQEVLQFKEKHRNDIHNLKQELSRLEYEIRAGNSKKAAEKAAEDIGKASKTLCKSQQISRVTKWTNVLSIPLGVASLFMGEPQIAIGAGALSIVGKTANLIETSIKNKNKWFEIII